MAGGFAVKLQVYVLWQVALLSNCRCMSGVCLVAGDFAVKTAGVCLVAGGFAVKSAGVCLMAGGFAVKTAGVRLVAGGFAVKLQVYVLWQVALL